MKVFEPVSEKTVGKTASGVAAGAGGVLARIVARKREEIARLRESFVPPACDRRGPRRSLRRALESCPAAPERPRIIAEIKRASPSAGRMREEFSPPELARAYAAGGAAALSIVTDAHFFQGELDWISAVRPLVEVPILRKDFILDPLQLRESRAAGADAVLLIAALLTERELAGLLAEAAALDLECLVEIHDETDLDKVCRVRPAIVGINNRDLRDFSINLETSVKLAARLPSGTLVVSESGIGKAADIRHLQQSGIDAFLIGTSLVRARDPRARLLRLIAAREEG